MSSTQDDKFPRRSAPEDNEDFETETEEDESHGGVVARAEASRGIRNDRKRKGGSRQGGSPEEESYESANSRRQGYSDNPSRDRDAYKDAYKVDETPADTRVFLDGPLVTHIRAPTPSGSGDNAGQHRTPRARTLN
ncbi:hypothetical protein HZH68_009221 [Vespula germanica]|uniref:Uncharacterized protein n=1 Tax=Vespula germanica TaxID=30212 RepID=A0A834JX04_VESGE|nr:hypothetical protein HZH68_009221 [Vespula germanica]